MSDYNPGANLRKELESISAPEKTNGLSEILYTAEETNIMEYGVSKEDALKIWKMVELSRSISPEVVKKIKM